MAQSATQPPTAKTRVAVVIPILNEGGTHGRTLNSLMKQDYPHDLIEILIVDGGSSDNWESIVGSFGCSDVIIRSLANPKRTTAAAVNLALRSTDAEAILWISGHCLLSPNYVAAVVEAFEADQSRIVGGVFRVTGQGIVGTLNALVLNSRFGTGTANWRFDRKPGYTKAVTFALFSRRKLLEIGGLDERLIRHQDNDLIDRLQRNETPFCRVDAVADYLAPQTFAGLWRRAWSNGSWNLWCWRLGIGGFSWWHLTPMAAVGIGVALLVASIWASDAAMVLLILAGIYILMAVGFACAASKNGPAWAIPVLPVLFFVHHVIYGLGSWQALTRRIPVPPGSLNEMRGDGN